MKALRVLGVPVVLCAALAGGAAGAVTVEVAVSGTCLSDCGNVGLAAGDAFGGTIRVDDAFFSENGHSGNQALESYAFAFGNFSFSDADPPDPGFTVSWGPTAGSVAGFLISAFVSSDPARPGPLLHLDALLGGRSFASHDGYRTDVPGCCAEIGLGAAAELSLDPLVPIPVPAPVWLLASAMLGIWGFRARHRA